jgi:ribosome-binding factor A
MDSVRGLPGPGDGLDPRLEHRGGGPGKVARKTLQLCGQVARTIEVVLAEQPDDTLRDLHVVSVVPAPDESRLLVTVGPLTPSAPFDPVAVMAHLQAASAHLRAEVAAAITRRRAPGLAFQVTTPP